MWKINNIETERPLDEILSDMEALAVTEYGPRIYATDISGAPTVAKVDYSYSHSYDPAFPPRLPNDWGWTAIYRLSDLPKQAEACRKAGVDPEGVYVTHFGTVSIFLYWVETPEDADKLRLAWAQKHDVGAASAQRSVGSPFIGEDQRSMYKAVLRAP